MKNYFFNFIVVFIISCNCFSQSNKSSSVQSENEDSVPDSELVDNRPVLYYHIVEKINSRFGGSITSYNVSNLDNVSKKNLGTGNTRTIKPIYARFNSKSEVVSRIIKQSRAVSTPKINYETSIVRTEKEDNSSNKNLDKNFSSENETNLKTKPIVKIEKENVSGTRNNNLDPNLIQAKTVSKTTPSTQDHSSFNSKKTKPESIDLVKTNSKSEVLKSLDQKNLKAVNISEKIIIANKDNFIQNSSKTDNRQSDKFKLNDISSSKNEILDINTDQRKPQNDEEKNAVESSKKYVTVDVIGAYERILEKGYVSKDLLKKVGNSYFFKGNLEMAAKRYSQLFEIETDLETIYYERFSKSLMAIGQVEKADIFSKKYDKLSLQKNKHL